MQKFPLRMKDNDLLVTELYHDPSNDKITAISVYLTPKTSKFSLFINIIFSFLTGIKIILTVWRTVKSIFYTVIFYPLGVLKEMFVVLLQTFPWLNKHSLFTLFLTKWYNALKIDIIFTDVCGNWIEIAYGTSSGTVRVIVQHPETVGHGPQLFQTFTVHRFPVTKVFWFNINIF